MASERLYTRVLYPPDSRQMAALLTANLERAVYTCPMDDEAIQANSFLPDPPSLHSVRWLRRQLLGVLAEERLLGFVDVAVGFDHATQHLMNDRPIGLLRFLALPRDYTSPVAHCCCKLPRSSGGSRVVPGAGLRVRVIRNSS